MQQNHFDCSRVAEHALVLGPSGHVQSDPIVPAQSAQSFDSAIQPDPSQESVKPESLHLVPRSSAIKEQWQQESRLLRESQPDQSMKQS